MEKSQRDGLIEFTFIAHTTTLRIDYIIIIIIIIIMLSSSYLLLYSYTFIYCIGVVLSQYAAPQQFAHLRNFEGISSRREAIQHYLGIRRHVLTSYSIHLRETDCLTVEDGKDRLSRNVGDYESTLRNFPED